MGKMTDELMVCYTSGQTILLLMIYIVLFLLLKCDIETQLIWSTL